MNASKIVLTVLLPIFWVSGAHGQSEKILSLKNDLHYYLHILHAKKGFSGELTVAKEGAIMFREAVGLASAEHNIKIAPGSSYRIASITKTFTGTLIALAQEESKLNVDGKVVQYLPGLSDAFKNITIHQLLTHTSGLPHNEGISDYWQTKSKLQFTKEQVIAEINTLDLLFTPGSRMHYSSLGYYLLGAILETVYQNDFESILKNKILEPLQMTETGSAATLKIIPKMTSAYHLLSDDSLVVAPYRNYSMLKGAGDMYATSTDLLKWTNSFKTNKLLANKAKDRVFTPASEMDNTEDSTYGYGWYIKTERPTKYYHGGGTWGYSSYIALYPRKNISIILLSNISALPVKSIAADIERIVYGLPFEMPKIEIPVVADSVDLTMYNGTFIAKSNGMKLNIQNTEDALFAQLAGKPAFEIYPKGNHQFFGKKVDITITFEIHDNAVTQLTAEGRGQTFHFKKSSN